MASKRKNPPPGSEGRAQNCRLLASCDGSEITQNLPNLNEIRAAHLARRFRLMPTMAVAVAELAFGEAR